MSAVFRLVAASVPVEEPYEATVAQAPPVSEVNDPPKPVRSSLKPMKFRANRSEFRVVTPASVTEVPVPADSTTAPAVEFSITVARVVPVETPLNSYILKYKSSPELLPPVKVGAEVLKDRPIQR